VYLNDRLSTIIYPSRGPRVSPALCDIYILPAVAHGAPPFVNRFDLRHPPTYPEPSFQVLFSSSPHRMAMKSVYPLVVSWNRNHCDLVSLSHDANIEALPGLHRSGRCSKHSSESFLHPLHDIAPSSSTGRSMPAMIQHATIEFYKLLGERRHITIVCQLLLRVSPESNILTFPTSLCMKYKPHSPRSLYSSLSTPPWPHRRCPPK
jgi:hypothetical protein